MPTITDRGRSCTVTLVIIGPRGSACPSHRDEKPTQFRRDLVNFTHTTLIAVVRVGNDGKWPHDSDLHASPPGVHVARLMNC
jgi:hypothetical protein